MYSRKAVLQSQDPTDYNRLRNFAHELASHSMYQPILNELKSWPGFVRKEHTMIDDIHGQTFVSQIIFEDKAAFDSYIGDESHASLWDYLFIIADQNGISVEVIDQETN